MSSIGANMKYTLVLSHGFGMDPSLWQDLLPFFKKDLDIHDVILWDHGYFGRRVITIPKTGVLVGVGHSLGLAHLICSSVAWHALIGVNSFMSFVGFDPVLRARRMKELDYFEKTLWSDPERVLKQFYKKCGFAPHAQASLNMTHLREDFPMLREAHRFSVPGHFLYEKEDRIVPLDIIQDNLKQAPHISFTECIGQTHVLPISDPELVYLRIKDFLL